MKSAGKVRLEYTKKVISHLEEFWETMYRYI